MKSYNLKKEIKQFKKLKTPNKLSILFIYLLLFIIGILVGNIFIKGTTPALKTSGQERVLPTKALFPTQPAPTKKPEATLSLYPSSQTLKLNEPATIAIMLDGQPADAVDVVVNFDASVFQASNLRKGTAFSDYPQQAFKIDNRQGIITVSAVHTNQTPFPSLPVTIATFSLTGTKEIVPSYVSFDRDATVVAKDGVNILGPALGGSYIVGE